MKPFADRVLRWFDAFGRHDLPWQQPRAPYRVWVSEIMLQQTQVSAVIPYFNRFMARFPNIETLASAPMDEVLKHWAGLGYYARARNLHRAANTIVQAHGGVFPQSPADIEGLPGIGPSTAGAIRAQAFGQRAAILDGNVRRLLARHAAVPGWTGQADVQKKLWKIAETLLPEVRLPDYTQALMDLGSTVCRIRNPDCAGCPVRSDCQALAQGRVESLPAPRPKRARQDKSTHLLILINERREFLLCRRPPTGIWGGLWCPPMTEFEPVAASQSCEQTAEDSFDALLRDLGRADCIGTLEGSLPPVQHVFTHFDLQIKPRIAAAKTTLATPDSVDEPASSDWFALEQPARWPALPTPIRKLLDQIRRQSTLPLQINGSSKRPTMTKTVNCIKLGKPAEALDRAPYPGPLGQRILENVSKPAWAEWLQHQTRLINEYRLTLSDAKARKFLAEEMEKYFFGGGELAQTSYVPPKNALD